MYAFPSFSPFLVLSQDAFDLSDALSDDDSKPGKYNLSTVSAGVFNFKCQVSVALMNTLYR